MKNFTYFLLTGFLLTMYGCNVYHSNTSSLDEAIQSQERVRVVTADNVFYEFKQLKKENNQIIGLAGRDSNTAKMLSKRPSTVEGKNLRFVFEESEIISVYLRNKKMSNIISFGVPVVGAAGLIGVTSEGFKPDIGN